MSKNTKENKEKKNLLKQLRKKIKNLKLLRSSVMRLTGRILPTAIELYQEQVLLRKYQTLAARRYIHGRVTYRSCNELIATFERDLDDSDTCWLRTLEFNVRYGMTKKSVLKIHQLIKNHSVFEKKKKGRPQRKSLYQLMILLCFLRTEGSGMSNQRGRQVFGIASGSCDKYRTRSIVAICESMQDNYFWPDRNERKEISKSFEKINNLPGTVGAVDGTMIPLAFKPQRNDFADFKGRKHLYTLTMMVVNDHKRRIRYFHAGWPGSVHDERVFSNSALAAESETRFSDNQYLLGDSAYSNRNYLVSSYKKVSGGSLNRDQELFNKALGKVRMSAEHTIGMLKGRFPFLRSVRMVIKDGKEGKESMKKIIRYITVCVIIHNYLIGWEPEADDHTDLFDQDSDNEHNSDNEIFHPVPDGASNDTRREQLKNYFMEHYN